MMPNSAMVPGSSSTDRSPATAGSPIAAGSPTTPGSPITRTQESIVAAYAELIEELGTDDVSFRLIARRAGVGERTVFRSYGTRIELLLATAEWLEGTVFARAAVSSLFDVPLAIRQSMVRYAARPELAHMVAETTMRGVSGADPSPRRRALDDTVARELPSVDLVERTALVAALTHLDSASMWVTLHREFAMSSDDAADAAAWAAEAVLDPMRVRVTAR